MDMNQTSAHEALTEMIQAIGQCVTAYTNFAERAQRLLTQTAPSSAASRKPAPHHATEFLGVRELAQILPLSPATIRHLANKKEIPSVRAGKKIVFDLPAVLAALNYKPISRRPNHKGRTVKSEESVGT